VEAGELLGEGREAEVFLQADGGVLKLMRDPADGARVSREASACSALRHSGGVAPHVLDTVRVDGRPGLVMERIQGTSMLSLLERRPLTVLSVAGALARAHATIHEMGAPGDLPSVHDQLAERITRAALLSDDVRDRALRLLSSLPAGDRLCHGDFHLGNVMGSSTGPVVIDWGYAAGGDPVGDVAQSVVLHRTGAMPPGTSALFSRLARAGRSLLTGRYLSVYRRFRPFDQESFGRWLFVHAAARMGEPVDDEHPALRHLLERARTSLR
jgi:aminoglycoside phosphotransferase (APT) family kinase protein